MSKPIFDGSVTLRGSPLLFVPKLLKPIKDKHIMSPFELKMKKMFEALKKGKKEKKKGGRKFRRSRRKRRRTKKRKSRRRKKRSRRRRRKKR